MLSMKVWCFNPQAGGIKISPDIQKVIAARVRSYELTKQWYPQYQLKLRYKAQFCYLDASENGKPPFPIGRFRYFNKDEISLAFYTYSNEKYEPCLFASGKWIGTIEEAIDICALYLV